MQQESIDDLEALIAVAREGSFTRAAAKLGVSQSALSQTIRGLETQVGLRLLTRTTRSVAPTDAGQRLIDTTAPRLEAIREELAALHGLRDKPAGSFRITTSEHAAQSVLWPALRRFLPRHPDIKVELATENSLTNIVSEQFDAGVRLDDLVDKDMIAVPISPDQRMLVVGSPTYFEGHDKPASPQDLVDQRCINLRLPTRGGLYAWEFEKDGRALTVRVDGQLVLNSQTLMLEAALAGFGLAYLPADVVQPGCDAGDLVAVLEDWSPSYPGYRLYFPSRRQQTPAFALLIEALRYRPSNE
jgi:DNA-binding transcriptional LysR family regulator